MISCGARLAPFDIPQLREIMSYDELELDRIGDRKTAVFFTISDTTPTYNFIVALAFSQMFNLLCERADNVHGGRLPHHVRVLWDEAANTGQVPNLEKLVAVIRSREVSLCLFYQQLAQCKAIYDKHAETILGNMDSVIFLGGREASTIKEISENWLGKATISMQTEGRSRGQSESYNANTQRLGRELMTPSELATMRSLTDTCILIGVLGFAVFLGLSFLLARWAVKPVETAWNQQRQFVADASHELKTPLTVILTNAELLQEPEYDEQARSRFVDSIMTMSRQMRGLVESLLELARVDNGGQNMVFSRLNFSELVSDALLPFEPVYFEKGLTLESNVEENLFVKGSQQHLKQVADILLDNASKYASADSTVRVILRRQGSHCLLSVASAGDAISREDLKNIFKRFYRMDKARSMNHSYGLGLSIADSIVGKHGGKIWAESADGVNTFFVQLSAA